ncbi:MAG: 3-deoxy-manno-octulosonate cytidylyltransferase [Sodalis sp. (in: enterobacteria)]
MNFIAIIPARYASRRLPGKPLVDINGKPMIIRVMEQAQASGADRIIVATDHPGVAEIVEKAGGEVCLSCSDYQSGTERLQKVIDHYGFPDNQIVVNVQGDEPLIPPSIIRQVADNLANVNASMATLAVPITKAIEAFNPNAVKVVIDARGYALYFSRATIPWDREGFAHSREHISNSFLLRHIGIYAYYANFIRRYVKWPASPLEKIELLEQLRVLWYGEKIHVAEATVAPGISVDTLEELEQVRLLF